MGDSTFSSNLFQCDAVVIQPTKFCNIDCSYCYLPHRNSRSQMSLSTLRQIITRLAEEELIRNKSLKIIWHIGEPLAIPITFYRDAVSNIREILGATYEIRHSVQTNATLISEAWCRFFKENNFEIGVSLDGPKHIHDRMRRTRSGRGSFDRAMHGIRLLQQHGIFVSTIAVLTNYSLDFPDEMFDFFVANQIRHVGFNFEEITGSHKSSTIEAMRDYEKCSQFFARLLERQRLSSAALTIREVKFMSQTLLLDKAKIGQGTRTPLSILSFDTEGNFSTFCPELLTTSTERFPSFLFGNIHMSTIRSLTNNSVFRQVHSEIDAGISKCRTECEYFEVCGGGIPSNKVCETGSFNVSQTDLCRLKIQLVAEHVSKSLERTLGDL
jgi:uncharacterized protein